MHELAVEWVAPAWYRPLREALFDHMRAGIEMGLLTEDEVERDVQKFADFVVQCGTFRMVTVH